MFENRKVFIWIEVRAFMPIISGEVSESLSEYLILPRETPRSVRRRDITLETRIGDVRIGIPFLSAAMNSVTGKELALGLAREDGLPVVPSHGVPIEEQCAIVQAVHGDEMQLIDKPTRVQPNQTLGSVLDIVAEHGHSTIFVTDDFRKLFGVFNANEFAEQRQRSAVTRDTQISEVMRPFDRRNQKIPYHVGEISIGDVKRIFEERKDISYLVLVGRDDQLLKVAFRRDMRKKNVAGAIGTHGDWYNRARALAEAGVDVTVMDTSDAHGYWAPDLIRKGKKDKKLKDIPLIAGNVITAKAFRYLADAGADVVKGGMGIASICITSLVKGMGRGQFTVARELAEARDNYFLEKGRYVPLIIDGGIKTTADMAVALAFADAIMMGRMFNGFYEAAGDKLNDEGHPIKQGGPIAYVSTWGEGSVRAVNLMRYGIPEIKQFFEQGVEGMVPYAGRLKPGVEKWVNILTDVLFGSGVTSLADFRRYAVLEKMSGQALREAGAHSIIQEKK